MTTTDNDTDSQRTPNVLIVDDVPHNIQIIASILNKKGYEISFANNGLRALKIAEKLKPDLILLDIMMPEMDGIETCKHLKNNPSTKDIPVIFLTAKSQSEDIIRGLNCGAVDYVTKPFNNAELLQRVLTHLELKSSKDQLQKYIKLINKQKTDLQHKNGELEELVKMKDRIFSIVAHDLKNPFNSLIGFTELLLDDLEEYNVEQVTRMVSLINDTANKGYLLLQNFLEWTMIQSGRMSYRPELIDVPKIVSDAIMLHQSTAVNKNINIINHIESQSQMYADENMMASVVRNLISNALKYTPKGGEVLINSITDENQIIINVTDTGIGIDDTHQKEIFQKDERKSSVGTDGEKGTGLGMLLCRDFVKTNGGEIWVKSEKGKGSTFSFSIPLRKSEA